MKEIDAKTKEKIIGLLSVLFPHAKIYIFGSRARGTHTSSSDLDIAIDNGKKIEPMLDVGEAREVLNALYLTFKIDVVDYHRVTEAMRQLIDQEGIIWKR